MEWSWSLSRLSGALVAAAILALLFAGFTNWFSAQWLPLLTLSSGVAGGTVQRCLVNRPSRTVADHMGWLILRALAWSTVVTSQILLVSLSMTGARVPERLLLGMLPINLATGLGVGLVASLSHLFFWRKQLRPLWLGAGLIGLSWVSASMLFGGFVLAQIWGSSAFIWSSSTLVAATLSWIAQAWIENIVLMPNPIVGK